jgi:hypothetical protein
MAQKGLSRLVAHHVDFTIRPSPLLVEPDIGIRIDRQRMDLERKITLHRSNAEAIRVMLHWEAVTQAGRQRMSALSPEAALQELKPREPIFHRRQYGTTRGALDGMTDEAFWEVGASGRVYRRDYCISTLLEFYKNPEPHDYL